ncbi:MAG: phage tail protein I, partial [Pusillimonas sp.]|nr:phage tail protein I [Pusillimonas sp.]
VQEWWQTQPAGVPGTFALKVGVTDTGISEETYNELSSLIDDARPVSRHMTGLAISLESRGGLYFGCALQDGDEFDVYPPAPPDLIVSGAIGRGGREHTIDTLDIAHG